MDEDNGVKAPVTRLRRRLSVEQPDDSKSPGPATPTKKRGRLAAKPQLELINEDVNIETKKVTKKAATKDLAEATEEKPLTPARRSTRIKSNTSIVSETAQNYGSPRAKRAARRTSQVGSDNESTSTPVRQTRKTRKDSASSIDKVGSDNESTSTPVRQTRKTRRDSASSIDKLESTLASNPNFDSCIITVIVEETDPTPQNQNGSATENEKNEIVLRKSPRLKEKIHDKGKAKKNNDSQEEIADTSNNTLNETTNKIKKNTVSAENNTIITEKEPTQLLNTSLKISKEVDDNSKQKLSETNISTTTLDDQNSSENKKQKADSQSKINDSLSFDDSKISKQAGNKKDVTINTEEHGQLSDTSLNIIKTSGDKSKHRHSDSHIILMKNQGSSKTKRQKTISLTSTSQSEISDSVFFSDNEKSKKRVVKKDVFKDMSSNERVVDNVQIDNNDLCPTKLTDTKTGGLLHQMELNSSANNEIEEISETNATPKSNKSRNKSFKSPSNKLLDIESSLGTAENMKAMSDQDETKSDTTFLEKPSQRIIQSADILEESYVHIKSNVTNKHLDSEDQCVPVVETRESGENSERINSIILNKSNNIMNVSKTDLRNSSILNKSNKQNSMNDSCEPMDIDVTIPNTETSQFNKSSENVKPVTSFYEVNASLINKSNETSKSKSSISAQNLEKSETENKSTLIISQINDVSSSENNVSKSLQLYQEVLSKSTSSDINKEKIMDKKRLSLEQYSTSTPLQQKHTKKLEMQITTYENGSKKTDNSRDSYNKDISIISKSRELNSSSSSESEEKSSKTKSLLEDEADVASDDYESGDSQDEDERQYEAENEVLEKGETLDSEEEFSNDSDYEKDSFVISSNEEDQELLSGSADDLSMSDNELTMSKKSKEKYNMRKIKEQKKASKEMFEARHKLDKSANKSDLKKSLQRSQILESSEDEIEHKKKYKHRRLNSSNEDDLNNSNTNKSLNKRTKKNRLLSESQSECNESTSKEQEITVFNDSAIDDDPLSTKIKQEPKTPLKELNISTVQINDNIEEVEVENNVSFSKTNQTFDPLCSVMVDENSSSLSENPDIVNNYDSILNQLNNECVKSKSLKSHHVSINMDKESKKTKASILDELNVTHTKKSKRNNKSNSVDIIDAPQTIKVAKKAKQNKISNNVDKDSSSDSIDLKLLFSEESTDFDNDKGQTMQTGKRKDSADNFIPLKRTPGKTNIINEQDDEQSSNDEIQFIIDTEGSKQKTDDSWNALLTESAKKKNKKTKLRDISRENLVTHDEGANDEDEDVPLEVPIEISKNEKSRKSINTVDTTEKQKQDIGE
ncbi:unnamed protein product [Diatraea saccharalis]|uniref:Uncharacterized protein n=1 Tax=Diatraea saccharalis TaxID=40085 RepID=A0A9P0C6J9_9NEOP|nr:unnamed protein product [Diatraea saccharalis]